MKIRSTLAVTLLAVTAFLTLAPSPASASVTYRDQCGNRWKCINAYTTTCSQTGGTPTWKIGQKFDVQCVYPV
ncbi:MAG: hypothetical protein JWM47_1038 [Acidimicrobiales bacterium]|nr:hypothetical protein [Acidimicrobiales bacterium]